LIEDLVDVLSGAFVADILVVLHESGGLEALQHPMTPADLAATVGCDRRTMRALLQFLAATTRIVVVDDCRYQLAEPYRRYGALGFQLDKFLRAYGPAVAGLKESLWAPDLRSGYVDRDALADAFTRRVATPPTLTAEVIRAWSITSLIDLGCGPGSLLIELAQADPAFRGWGVEVMPQMLASARAKAKELGVDDRVDFIAGDVRDLARLPLPPLPSTAGVHAGSLLNEFFAEGPRDATVVLATIREVFTGRLIFVEDYYGRLGVDLPDDFRHARLQDLVQVASGQGIPPPDIAGWDEVYRKSGCTLLHRYEGTNEGVAWFIHVCALAAVESGPIMQGVTSSS
jgi:SAM-dependent methyltransferase